MSRVLDSQQESMVKAMRYAVEHGKLVMRCGDKSDALALRTKFYIFFKLIKRHQGEDWADELSTIRAELNLGAYANGELILKRSKDEAHKRIMDSAVAEESFASIQDLKRDLADVHRGMSKDELELYKLENEPQPKKKKKIRHQDVLGGDEE